MKLSVQAYLAVATTEHGVKVASAQVTPVGLAHGLPYN
jgi:hypothetical protein